MWQQNVSLSPAVTGKGENVPNDWEGLAERFLARGLKALLGMEKRKLRKKTATRKGVGTSSF